MGWQRADEAMTQTVFTQSKSPAAIGILFLGCFAWAGNLTPLTVVESRVAQAEIVCPDRSHAAERFAADELSRWIGEMTGTYVPVRNETTATAGRPKLYVGTDFAKDAFAADFKVIGKTDGFSVRTDGTNVYVFGTQPKGTLHAAYALLERNSDIIWPRPDPTVGVVHSLTDSFVVVRADFREVPRTRVREWQWNYTGRGGAPNEALWGARNRQNQSGTPEGPLASCFVSAGKGHGLQRYARPDTNFSVHPEWFPLIGGVRTRKGGQLCMTASGLADEIYASVTNELAQKYPDVSAKRIRVDYFNLTCADNHQVCECAACSSPFRCENGNVVPISDPCFRSAQYYALMNQVARLLAKTHPRVTIGTYAYALTRYAPPFELAPNISVELCLTDYDERASLTDPVRNLSARRHIDDWGDKCRGLWLRTYCGWSGRNLRAIEYAYAEACRYAAKRRFPLAQYSAEIQRDEEVTGRHGAEIWDTSAISYWVISRLWWDPFQDVDVLRREFVMRTYREAAPQMQAYFDAVRDAYAVDRMPATYRITCTAFMTQHYLYEPGLGPKLLGLLDEALAIARHPVSREIIRRQRCRLQVNLDRAAALPTSRLAVRPLADGWGVAEVSRPFVGAAGIYGASSDKYGGPAEVKTTFQAMHDDQALYLRVRCEAPDARTIYGASGNGSPEEQPDCDDALEIFLCRPDTGAYWQWIMDPGAKGGPDIVFDAKGDDARWRGNWTRKVERDDFAWTMTMRVPFADMAFEGCPDELRVNVIRARSPLNPPEEGKRKPRHFRSSWTGAGVHDSGGFGLLKFVK